MQDSLISELEQVLSDFFELFKKDLSEIVAPELVIENNGRHTIGQKESKKKPRNIYSAKQKDILNSWLNSNQNHPYPTAEEKKELIESTGLTKTQIENWFGNARKRYLKRS
jgi:hypothetical protein